LSQLLREAMTEISHGSVSVKIKLQHLGSKFINATEISDQEAAYKILGLHLSAASEGNVFINTCHPDKGVRIVRSNRELEQLPANSADIFERNLFDRYVQRHEQLESLCIAEFAAWFKFSKLNARSEQSNKEYDESIDYDADEENNVAAQSYQVLDGTGRVKRRNHALILRWVRFSLISSPSDYFREHVMLFFPWRSEETELISNDNERTFRNNFEIIKRNKEQYASQYLDEEFRALTVPDVGQNVNVLQDKNDSNGERR